MKNKLTDLHNHLFAQLERLSDEDLSKEDLDKEVKRADAIVSVSDQIVSGQRLRLSSAKLYAQHGDRILPMLPEVGSGKTQLIDAKRIEGEAE